MQGILIFGIILVLVSFSGMIFFLITQFSNKKTRILNPKKSFQSPIYRKEERKDKYQSYQENNNCLVERDKKGKITLKQKLIYANMKIPPVFILCIKCALMVLFFSIVYIKFSIFLSLTIGWIGGVIVDAYIERKIQKRFKEFDKDYPVFLQSMTSLLKSGLTPMLAFETAVENYEEDNILKSEVKKVLEKLRAGVPEDIAIGSFASTISHPEAELFIQAVILGKNLGGSLSTTLDRIAEQARKKQFFRSSAIAAIAQQRGSMYIVMGLLIGTVIFLGMKTPDLVFSLFESTVGNYIIEFAIFANIIGVYFMKKTSKIKV